MSLYDHLLNRLENAQNFEKALKELKSSGGNQYRYLWDKTGLVKLHTRVYYTETQKNVSTYVSLTKVVGGLDAGGTGGASVGNGVSVVLNQCLVKQFGKDKRQW